MERHFMNAVWFKQGVTGDLRTAAQKGFGRVAQLYISKGKDLFVTSIREGNHGHGSLHYIGLAFDFRREGVNLKEIKTALGPNWDVIDEGSHVHAEYDPK